MEKLQAIALVNRFGNQPYWSLLSDEAIGELVKAVQSAQTLEQAVEAVDWLLEHNAEQIMPAHIYARLRETPVASPVSRDRNCRTCRGTGYANSWHILVEDNRTRKRSTRRVMCHSCSVEGQTCQYRVVPADKSPDIAGLFYCEARVRQMQWPLDMGVATGLGPLDSAAPCGNCDFGRQRGQAYHQRESEQQAKREARTK